MIKYKKNTSSYSSPPRFDFAPPNNLFAAGEQLKLKKSSAWKC